MQHYLFPYDILGQFVLNVLDRNINLNVKAQIHYMQWKYAWDLKKSPHLNNKWESSLDLSPQVAEVMYGAPAGTYATAGLTWAESKEADEKLSWKKQVLWHNASSLNEMDFIS